jgi:taurine transport system permease protein
MNTRALSIVSIVVILAVWELSTSILKLVPPLFLPSPSRIVLDFFRILVNPFAGATFTEHLLTSLYLVVSAFVIAVISGVTLGILTGWYEVLDRIVYPIFQLVRPIPPLAWIPLAIVWFGIGVASKIFVIWLSAFVPSLINAYIGIKMTDRTLIEAARVYGAKDRDLLWHVAIPSALPLILTGIRLSLGNAWMTIVAAELLAASAGLGYMMQIARRTLEPSVIALGMLAIGILGTLMTRGLFLLEKKLCPWREQQTS